MGTRELLRGLHFHLDTEKFAFYRRIRWTDDPLWVDVTELMQRGMDGLGETCCPAQAVPDPSQT